MGAEVIQTLLCPGQVICFFARRVAEVHPQRRIPGDRRLRCIQGLGADLADVIDAHQGPGFPSFGFTQRACRL